jgi:hypothetical protein
VFTGFDDFEEADDVDNGCEDPHRDDPLPGMHERECMAVQTLRRLQELTRLRDICNNELAREDIQAVIDNIIAQF